MRYPSNREPLLALSAGTRSSTHLSIALARVLVPGGHLLLAFQAEGEPLHREDAFGSGLPLTSYRHSVSDVVGRLEETGIRISTTGIRAPELEHETTS
jgi:hypothetical protein